MNYRYLSVAGLTLALAMSAAAQSNSQTEAQKSFETMKTMAGSWTGQVKTTPPQPEVEGKQMQASLRVTSMGHAMVHEMRGEGRPDDPITMVYLDGDRLILTHYCDAGNRPRMVGRESADGKAVDFNFLDVSGSTDYGHMDHAVFTVIDANHHNEDWTYMQPGDKPVHVHLELTRAQ
ncbi:MAG: hypothetical protein ABSE92_01115 [Terriglobales bacterium]|jgi:hypothetical protein